MDSELFVHELQEDLPLTPEQQGKAREKKLGVDWRQPLGWLYGPHLPDVGHVELEWKKVQKEWRKMPAEVNEILGKPLLVRYNERYKKDHPAGDMHVCNRCGDFLETKEEFVVVMDRPSGFSIGKLLLFEAAYLYCTLHRSECMVEGRCA